MLLTKKKFFKIKETNNQTKKKYNKKKRKKRKRRNGKSFRKKRKPLNIKNKSIRKRRRKKRKIKFKKQKGGANIEIYVPIPITIDNDIYTFKFHTFDVNNELSIGKIIEKILEGYNDISRPTSDFQIKIKRDIDINKIYEFMYNTIVKQIENKDVEVETLEAEMLNSLANPFDAVVSPDEEAESQRKAAGEAAEPVAASPDEAAASDVTAASAAGEAPEPAAAASPDEAAVSDVTAASAAGEAPEPAAAASPDEAAATEGKFGQRYVDPSVSPEHWLGKLYFPFYNRAVEWSESSRQIASKDRGQKFWGHYRMPLLKVYQVKNKNVKINGKKVEVGTLLFGYVVKGVFHSYYKEEEKSRIYWHPYINYDIKLDDLASEYKDGTIGQYENKVNKQMEGRFARIKIDQSNYILLYGKNTKKRKKQGHYNFTIKIKKK